MMMHDDFLYERRATPRPEFVESLRDQLKQARPAQSRIRRIALPVLKTAVAISLMTFVILAISPETRAYVSKVVQNAIEYLHFGNVSVQVMHGDEGITPGQSYPVPEKIMSLAEAQALVSFKLPSWLPNDMKPVDKVKVIYTGVDSKGVMQSDNVIVTLEYPEIAPQGEWAQLYFYVYENANPQILVGEGNQAQLIDINGNKGTLITGNWEGGTFGGDSKLVVWTMDGLTYSVSSTMLPEDILLKVARSVK